MNIYERMTALKEWRKMMVAPIVRDDVGGAYDDASLLLLNI